jgi:hypothetical protein
MNVRRKRKRKMWVRGSQRQRAPPHRARVPPAAGDHGRAQQHVQRLLRGFALLLRPRPQGLKSCSTIVFFFLIFAWNLLGD